MSLCLLQRQTQWSGHCSYLSVMSEYSWAAMRRMTKALSPAAFKRYRTRKGKYLSFHVWECPRDVSHVSYRTNRNPQMAHRAATALIPLSQTYLPQLPDPPYQEGRSQQSHLQWPLSIDRDFRYSCSQLRPPACPTQFSSPRLRFNFTISNFTISQNRSNLSQRSSPENKAAFLREIKNLSSEKERLAPLFPALLCF